MDPQISQQQIDVAAEQHRFILKVYNWMTMALVITGGIAFLVANSPSLVEAIINNRILFYGILIAQFLLVMGISGMINCLSAATATLLFVLYSSLTGVTFSFIFLLFTASSIASTFLVTAGTFAVMSIYGMVTGRDLTKLGSLLFMALIGLIIASVVNMFLHSETLNWITSFAGVLIFTGLIAYDTQKIKNMNVIGNEGTEEDQKEAIMGALALYLDFINLFLYLLRFMGRKK